MPHPANNIYEFTYLNIHIHKGKIKRRTFTQKKN